jgi:hypothetical protein
MFIQLLERIALNLEQRHIPYMVVGGQAVLIYGEPRLTRDIDITLGVGPDRVNDLLAIAHAASWRVLVEKPAEFVQRTLVLPLEDPESRIRIDLIFSFSPYERQAIDRGRPISIGKGTVRFATVEDVVVHKIVAGRPRDLEDVRSIMLRNHELDRGYVRRWLTELGQSIGKDCVGAFDDLEQR